MAKCIETFFTYCGNAYNNVFGMFIQICGFNKARQRDKLARLLDEFGVLVDEVSFSCDDDEKLFSDAEISFRRLSKLIHVCTTKVNFVFRLNE